MFMRARQEYLVPCPQRVRLCVASVRRRSPRGFAADVAACSGAQLAGLPRLLVYVYMLERLDEHDRSRGQTRVVMRRAQAPGAWRT
jgi:hypothetical protein